MTAIQAMVHGRVQGVGFRWSCLQEATRLGVCGWVRNLPSGEVELWAQGDPAAVHQLLVWCHEGPRWGHVDEVRTTVVVPRDYSDFRVR